MTTDEKLKVAITALKDIINPVGYFKKNLKSGEELDGLGVIHLIGKTQTYVDIAKEAIKLIDENELK